MSRVLRHIGMAKPSGHFYDRDPIGQEQRGVGMVQIMEAAVGYPGHSLHLFPHPGNRIREDMGQVPAAEYELTAAWLFGKGGVHPLEIGIHRPGDRNLSLPRLRLGSIYDEIPLCQRLHLLADENRRLLQVHITPPKPQHLTFSHARIHGQKHDGVETAEILVTLQRIQDSMKLLRGENLNFLPNRLGRLHEIDRVPADHL